MRAAAPAGRRCIMAEQVLPRAAAPDEPIRRPEKRFDLKRQPGFGVVAILCLVALYAPILIVVGFAFNDSRSVTRWSQFSLEWFRKVLANDDIHSAAANTLIIAACATVIATLTATAAALATT